LALLTLGCFPYAVQTWNAEKITVPARQDFAAGASYLQTFGPLLSIPPLGFDAMAQASRFAQIWYLERAYIAGGRNHAARISSRARSAEGAQLDKVICVGDSSNSKALRRGRRLKMI
jgi:hypothetical protein